MISLLTCNYRSEWCYATSTTSLDAKRVARPLNDMKNNTFVMLPFLTNDHFFLLVARVMKLKKRNMIQVSVYDSNNMTIEDAENTTVSVLQQYFPGYDLEYSIKQVCIVLCALYL